VAVDGAGNVYVSDSNDSSIRKITPAGVVSTIAGPTTPISNPYGIALDGAGNVYYASNCAIWKMAPAGTVATFAGSSCGSADGAGAAAQFDFPHGVALDAAGNVYVPDYHNNTIRKVTPAAVVTTLAGSTGLKGNSPAGARFELPHGVAVDAPGNLYVADTYDSVIRKITPTGTFTTLAGHENSPGNEDGTGTLAQFNYPQGVAADGIGNVYVADTQNHTIRKITPMGVVSTFAGSPGSSGTADGTGTAARFNQPLGVGVDAVGNVYVADWNNSAIRKITPAQVVTTIAGFELPMGVAVDGGGTVYVADTWHQTIKRIDPAGLVTTLAGSLNAAGGVDGTGADARFNFPKGVAVDGAGNVYVADTDNNSIRRITPAGVVSTIVGVLGLPVSGIVPGPLPALLAQPQGLVVDPSTGVLYITVDSAVMVAH
jgi:sugar lactone lactonase YvrE